MKDNKSKTRKKREGKRVCNLIKKLNPIRHELRGANFNILFWFDNRSHTHFPPSFFLFFPLTQQLTWLEKEKERTRNLIDLSIVKEKEEKNERELELHSRPFTFCPSLFFLY